MNFQKTFRSKKLHCKFFGFKTKILVLSFFLVLKFHSFLANTGLPYQDDQPHLDDEFDDDGDDVKDNEDMIMNIMVIMMIMIIMMMTRMIGMMMINLSGLTLSNLVTIKPGEAQKACTQLCNYNQ